MNDRFKFRVWDKISKRYFFLELKFGDNGYHPRFIEKPDFEQCTGLKDKNGKLIYEGDILFAEARDWKNKGNWNTGTIKTYWSVEYKDYVNISGFMVFGINRRFHKPLTKTALFNSEAVIVGNIHESADLLGEDK